jgi:hypothetical protein
MLSIALDRLLGAAYPAGEESRRGEDPHLAHRLDDADQRPDEILGVALRLQVASAPRLGGRLQSVR